jgi:hypothetical protein
MRNWGLLALAGLGLAPGGARAAAVPPANAPAALPAGTAAADADSAAIATPAPDSRLPMVLGAQYTYVLQHQSPLHAPYAGPLSLHHNGDTQPTNTAGIYTGWAPLSWAQLYLDTEKFTGAAVSGGTGLGGLTNGNAREWRPGLNKQFYVARLYARLMLPLGGGVATVARGADRIPGTQAARRLELKIGRMAAPDDFDQNRYAGSARTQFLNWSLRDDTAWDYAANARGYSDGIVLGYISPYWSLDYGIYRMPARAGGQPLIASLARASGQNLQLTLSAFPTGTIVRLLGYLNTAAMGSYTQALAIAAATHAPPDVAATARQGRRKHGFGLDIEQPLADDGDTGLFLRWGGDDGSEQSFAAAEVDRALSIGVQVSGREWRQPGAQVGLGLVSEALSAPHRAYLAAGGVGLTLGDGGLDYGPEQILEAYYRLQRIWPEDPGPVRWQFGPDIQIIRNPGYNRARGPVSFWALRLHVEY